MDTPTLDEMLEAPAAPEPKKTKTRAKAPPLSVSEAKEKLTKSLLVPDMPTLLERYVPTRAEPKRKAITVPEAVARIGEWRKEHDGERVDLADVRLAQCSVDTIPHRDSDKPLLHLRVPGQSPFPLRRVAFEHLCGAVGAPDRYLRRVPSGHAAELLTWGLRQLPTDEVRTLRLARGETSAPEVRAIVSGVYGGVDDAPLFAAIQSALESKAGGEVTELRSGVVSALYINYSEQKGPDGHALRSGVAVSNGELRNRSSRLAASIYRLICRNGMMAAVGANATRRHVGDAGRALEQLLSSFNDIDQKSLQMVQASQRAFGTEVDTEDAIRKLAPLRLTKDEVASVIAEAKAEVYRRDVLGEYRVELTEADEAVYKALDSMTMWDLVNGVTATARDESRPVRALELSDAGASLLVSMLG